MTLPSTRHSLGAWRNSRYLGEHWTRSEGRLERGCRQPKQHTRTAYRLGHSRTTLSALASLARIQLVATLLALAHTALPTQLSTPSPALASLAPIIGRSWNGGDVRKTVRLWSVVLAVLAPFHLYALVTLYLFTRTEALRRHSQPMGVLEWTGRARWKMRGYAEVSVGRGAKRRAGNANDRGENRTSSYFRTRQASSVTTATIIIPRTKPYRDSLRSSQWDETFEKRIGRAVKVGGEVRGGVGLSKNWDERENTNIPPTPRLRSTATQHLAPPFSGASSPSSVSPPQPSWLS